MARFHGCRCICDCDDDDGFTIQCDRCLVWQHCACFGMSQASVPDEYLCEQCDPRPVDIQFAQAHQQKRREAEARKALVERSIKRQNQTSTAHERQTANISTVQGRPRKPSQVLNLLNTGFAVPELPASISGTSGSGSSKTNKRKAGAKQPRRTPLIDTPTSVGPGRTPATPIPRDERLDPMEEALEQADKLEAWHVEFTPIGKNLVIDPAVPDSLASCMLDWQEGSSLKATRLAGRKAVAPVAGRSARSRSVSTASRVEELAVNAELEAGGGQGQGTNGTRRVSAGSEAPAEPVLSIIGNECVPVEIEGSSLADLSMRTVVKHISDSSSAQIFANVAQIASAPTEPHQTWAASRAFSRPVMHGLFADSAIPAGAFITEYRGELLSADKYRSDPLNQYAALGAVKPHVHVFPPPLNLAVDARRFGTESRYARFSCHPNAVLRPILFHRAEGDAGSRSRSRSSSPNSKMATGVEGDGVRQSGETSAEPELLFGLFAISDIGRMHEITLSWEWDDAHIVHFLPELVKNPTLEPTIGGPPSPAPGTPREGSSTPSTAWSSAALVALVEKGDFPYSGTLFSAKMNAVATALLGTSMCACIGSASASSGGGSGSSVKKQDCAVAQMLRVGQGMALLNVLMPGMSKGGRRPKLPDFAPLVGVMRGWRPLKMPPSPASEQGLDLGQKTGEVEHVERILLDEDAEMDVWAEEREEDEQMVDEIRVVSSDEDEDEGAQEDEDITMQHIEPAPVPEEEPEDGARTDSDASSLTDPLSGLSDQEVSEDDEDDSRFLLPIKPEQLDIVPSMLPIKKRAKANIAPSATVKPTKSIRDASTKPGPLLTSHLDGDSDDEADLPRPPKKRRRSSNMVDPSSPLSSVPSPPPARRVASPASRNSSLSPAPTLKEDSERSDNEEVEEEESDDSAGSMPIVGHSRARSISAARAKASPVVKKKRLESKSKSRSRSVHAEQERPKPKRHLRRGSIADITTSDFDSDSDSDDEPSPVGFKSAKDRSVKPKKERGAGRSKKDTLNSTPKVKKLRRVVSSPISERSEDSPSPPARREPDAVEERAIEPAAESTQAAALGEQLFPSASTPTVPSIPTEHSQSVPSGEVQEVTTAYTEGPADGVKSEEVQEEVEEAPPPPPSPKKEEPRVKLSLAEYKRRLAERRTSTATTAAPAPSAPAAASVPLPDIPLKSPAVATPTAASTDVVEAQPERVKENSTPPQSSAPALPRRPSTPPRTGFFPAVAAPPITRTVEIPRSPPPERSASFAQQRRDSLRSETPAAVVGVTAEPEAERKHMPPPPQTPPVLRPINTSQRPHMTSASGLPVRSTAQLQQSAQLPSGPLTSPSPSVPVPSPAGSTASLPSHQAQPPPLELGHAVVQSGWGRMGSAQSESHTSRPSPSPSASHGPRSAGPGPSPSPTFEAQHGRPVSPTASRNGFSSHLSGPNAHSTPTSRRTFDAPPQASTVTTPRLSGFRPAMATAEPPRAGAISATERAGSNSTTPQCAGPTMGMGRSAVRPVSPFTPSPASSGPSGFNPPRAPRALINPNNVLGGAARPLAGPPTTGANATPPATSRPSASMSPPSPAMGALGGAKLADGPAGPASRPALRDFAGVPKGPRAFDDGPGGPPGIGGAGPGAAAGPGPGHHLSHGPPLGPPRGFPPRGMGWGSRARGRGGRGRGGWGR